MMTWLPDPQVMLAKARALQPHLDEALRLLDLAVERYRPSRLFALFSGGLDSLCCTHVLSRHPLFAGVLHINTGIGIDQTHEYVRETCKAYGWPLFEYHSPIRYEDIIFAGGFPGPPLHTFVYSLLKERAIRLFMGDHKRDYHDRLGLVTGARRQESRRRMGTTQDIRREDTRIWINPLINWSKEHTLDYIEVNLLPHNPVVDLLHMSGDCLCGCFAGEDEMMELEIWYPDMAAYLHALEDQVLARGFPWRWGQSPPRWWRASQHGQLSLPGCDLAYTPLCVSCDARFADLQDLREATNEREGRSRTPRLWRSEQNPLQGNASGAQKTAQPPQGSPHVGVSVQRKRAITPLQKDIRGPWLPRDLSLLQQLCTQHDVPFELMLALFQLEHHASRQADRRNIQAGIGTLLSKDWSHRSPAVQDQETTNLAGVSSSRRVEQLTLW